MDLKFAAKSFIFPNLSWLAIAFLFCTNALATEISKSPAPDWITETPVSHSQPSSTQQTKYGMRYLLVDEQIHIPTQSHYFHYAQTFLTQNGVQRDSRITINFHPEYQKLTLHKLCVHRGNDSSDRLPNQKVRTLEREEYMTSYLYDGEVTVVLDLEDISVGDTLEYSYSIQGENPVFNGIYSNRILSSWNVPLDAFQLRVLHAENHPLLFKLTASNLEHTSSSKDGIIEHIWSQTNLPAIEDDGDTPVWYSPYSWVQLTEFKNWADVVNWALSFYDVASDLPPKIQEITNQLRSLPNQEDQILGALTYVQNNIRYLSDSAGVHSHRPHPVEDVVSRGYGDCKDKARLLCTMLTDLGFVAYPALVNTIFRHKIAEWLPSPLNFNHVIVALRYNDELYWLDPTRDHQYGSLRKRLIPPYGKALILSPVESQLTDIDPQRYAFTAVETIEHYLISNYRDAVTLNIRSTYQGSNCEWMRSMLDSINLEELKRSYLNSTAQQYPGVQPENKLTFDDDRQSNTIVCNETYLIKDFWQPLPQKDSHLFATIYPTLINEQLSAPTIQFRKDPLAIGFPKQVKQNYLLILPEPGSFKDEDFYINDPAFTFHYKQSQYKNILEVAYSYTSLSDHVSPENMETYLKNIRAARAKLDFSLCIPKQFLDRNPPQRKSQILTPSDKLSLSIMMTVFFTFALFSVTSAGCYFWQPNWRPAPADPKYNGLKGWLILLALTCFTYPVFIGLNFVTITSIVEQLRFQAFCLPLVLFNVSSNFFLFLFSFFLIVLLFKKRRTFPVFFMSTVGSNLLIALTNFSYVHLHESSQKSALHTLCLGILAIWVSQALIWIPYLLRSTRAKATFVKKG